jgi:hypothetical protein
MTQGNFGPKSIAGTSDHPHSASIFSRSLPSPADPGRLRRSLALSSPPRNHLLLLSRFQIVESVRPTRNPSRLIPSGGGASHAPTAAPPLRTTSAGPHPPRSTHNQEVAASQPWPGGELHLRRWPAGSNKAARRWLSETSAGGTRSGAGM